MKTISIISQKGGAGKTTLAIHLAAAAQDAGAVSLIVDGFCKTVFRELPMEFAVEAKKLLEVSLEGSVG